MDDDNKKILFLMRRPPHGSNYAYGGLDAMLMMGAYEQDVSVLFMDDGVYAIKKGQDTSELKVKEFSVTFRALTDHDIEKVYVEKESMESRGLTLDDLVINPDLIESSEVAKLLQEHDVIFPF